MSVKTCMRPIVALALLLLFSCCSSQGTRRKPNVTPVLCAANQDLSGLTMVNVTAGRGQIKLLATGSEACADAGNATEQQQCQSDWSANDARKAGRQLGVIVAKINRQLQDREVEKYEKLKKAAQDALEANTTSTDNSTNSTADPEPFDVLEEPLAELGLNASETSAWKAAAGRLKMKRSKGKPNPNGRRDEDGFSQQLTYVCHTTEGQTVTLYMRIGVCTTDDPCDDLDTVE